MVLPISVQITPDENSKRVCQEIKAHLSEYLDDELEHTVCAEIEAHLRACPDCRVLVDTMRQTILLYHTLEAERMPDAARARLYRALHLTELLEQSH
jgi:predicted anti-sigma-YlaC factor YlaD